MSRVNVNQPIKRIIFIDLCRGLLILMMTVRHSFGMLEISPQHWIYKLFIPLGWATVGFISLSGFTIGMLFLERMRDPVTRRKTVTHLHQRSWQLLIVMFLSNLFMLVSKFMVGGEIGKLSDIGWWLGLFTFKTPYTISSILIPTVLLVYISPIILDAIIRYKAIPILITSFVIALATSVFAANVTHPEALHYLLQRLFFEGDGYFPVLPMLLYGIMSISIGTLWDSHFKQMSIITVIFYYGLTFLCAHSEISHVILTAISGPARLIIINSICILLTKVIFIRHVINFIAQLGRFSLQSFILHRILLQAVTFAVGIILPPVSIELLFILITLLTLTGIWAACISRLRYPKLNRFFKMIYL